mmetsp:Transcript_6712/g.18949  ORF Transcript_6712/g.18949 Transcript_6712/m.18949 type:complete len:206 (+) Transcript_6712:1053-1670(+)
MIHGPLTSSSPGSPRSMSCSMFSGFAIRTSTPGRCRPALVMFSKSSSELLERSLYLATRLPSEHKGLVSVNPQPWINSTFSFSRYHAIISGGGAAPPQVSMRNLMTSAILATPRFSTAARTPCQTVGTPMLTWTCQSIMQSRRLSASMKRLLRTVRTPSIKFTKGTPQLSTWNIGTKGNTTSEPLRPSWSAPEAAKVCRYVDRWL